MKRLFSLSVLAAILSLVMHDAAGQDVKFDIVRHDLGVVKEGAGVVSHIFIFTNNGTAPLVVANVSTTCGCTATSYSRKPVMPGKRGEIRVNFDPANRSGVVSSNIYVVFDNGDRATFTLTGNVVPRERTIAEEYPVTAASGLRLDAADLFFGRVGQGTTKTIILGMANSSNKEITVAFSSDGKHIVAPGPVRIAPGEKLTVDVECNPGARNIYGVLDNVLTVSVSGIEAVRIPVKVFAIDNFAGIDRRKAPRALFGTEYEDMGILKARTVFTKEITVENRGRSPLAIRSVQTKGAVKSVTLRGGQTIAPGAKVTFTITLDTSKTGNITSIVTIFQNDPEQPIHEIRLCATVK